MGIKILSSTEQSKAQNPDGTMSNLDHEEDLLSMMQNINHQYEPANSEDMTLQVEGPEEESEFLTNEQTTTESLSLTPATEPVTEESCDTEDVHPPEITGQTKQTEPPSMSLSTRPNRWRVWLFWFALYNVASLGLAMILIQLGV